MEDPTNHSLISDQSPISFANIEFFNGIGPNADCQVSTRKPPDELPKSGHRREEKRTV